MRVPALFNFRRFRRLSPPTNGESWTGDGGMGGGTFATPPRIPRRRKLAMLRIGSSRTTVFRLSPTLAARN